MAPVFALVAVLLLGARGAPASSGSVGHAERTLRIGRATPSRHSARRFRRISTEPPYRLLAADEQLGFVHYTMGRIEPDYRDRLPEQRLYDDRVKLIAYLKTLFAQIAPAQSEINALRDTAKTATDPQTAKATVDLASQLQRALDKQHQLAIDSLGVVHAMADVSTGTNLHGFRTHLMVRNRRRHCRRRSSPAATMRRRSRCPKPPAMCVTSEASTSSWIAAATPRAMRQSAPTPFRRVVSHRWATRRPWSGHFQR